MQPELIGVAFPLIVLIFSIIIHEVAHGYAANAPGDPTAKLQKRLTLNPLPHIDPIGSILIPAVLVLTNAGILFGWAKPVPYNPNNLNKNWFARRFGESFVAVAGVATNLLIAVIFACIARFAFAAGDEVFGSLASVVTLVNLFLGLFNLIPIPPFDGYTFLRGLLPARASLAFRDLEDRIARGGIFFMIIVLLIFINFLSAPFYAFVMSIFNVLIPGQ